MKTWCDVPVRVSWLVIRSFDIPKLWITLFLAWNFRKVESSALFEFRVVELIMCGVSETIPNQGEGSRYSSAVTYVSVATCRRCYFTHGHGSCGTMVREAWALGIGGLDCDSGVDRGIRVVERGV